VSVATEISAELAALIEAWPKVPEDVRVANRAMFDSHKAALSTEGTRDRLISVRGTVAARQLARGKKMIISRNEEGVAIARASRSGRS
jgi:hypothetical protein